MPLGMKLSGSSFSIATWASSFPWNRLLQPKNFSCEKKGEGVWASNTFFLCTPINSEEMFSIFFFLAASSWMCRKRIRTRVRSRISYIKGSIQTLTVTIANRVSLISILLSSVANFFHKESCCVVCVEFLDQVGGTCSFWKLMTVPIPVMKHLSC